MIKLLSATLAILIATDCSAEYYGKMLGTLQGQHSLGGTVYAVNRSFILIKDFNYDGQGPDAFFWVGEKSKTNSPTPNGQGTIIPNEVGSSDVLGAYSSKTIVLNLGNLALSDLRWISVWCRQFSANFGHVTLEDSKTSSLPQQRNIGQFSRLAHGVSSGEVMVLDARTIRIQNFRYDGAGPDAYFLVGSGNPNTNGRKIPDETGSTEIAHGYSGQTIELVLPSDITFYDIDYLSLYCIRFTQDFGNVRFDNIPDDSLVPYIKDYIAQPRNCETLSSNFNMAWKIFPGVLEVTLSGSIGDREYMSFGVSGSQTSILMQNADVTVVSYTDGQGQAIDYSLNAYSLCSGRTGVCPDTAQDGQQNVQLISASRINGITTVTYRKPLNTGDSKDIVIDANANTQIIWALGGLNAQNQVTKHHTRITASKLIQFGRSEKDNCIAVKPAAESGPVTGWFIPSLSGENTKVFTASMGAAGGKRGYLAITGQQSWGIAWYINNLLIPEIWLKRGETYTFRVEGGTDPSNSAKYHPFYITDDPVGGYADKNSEQRQAVKVFAGVSQSGVPWPNATGRYCEYKPKDIDRSASSATFEDYFKTLELACDNGAPGGFQWTPDSTTPALVYYQCYTHNYLGWKIHIVNDYSEIAQTPTTPQSCYTTPRNDDSDPNTSPHMDGNIYILLICLFYYMVCFNSSHKWF